MEDLGITPQQFEDACNRQNTERIPIPFDQVLQTSFEVFPIFIHFSFIFRIYSI